MSKISGKTRYESFQEWHKWIQAKSPAFRNAKKKKAPVPVWMGYEEEY